MQPFGVAFWLYVSFCVCSTFRTLKKERTKLAERLYENNAIILSTTTKELELLQGMGNCYTVCGADFEGTIRMVGNARGLEPREVKQILRHIKEVHGKENEYIRLRSRLPKEFSM